MSQTNFSDFRQNLANYLDEVEANRAPLLVTRQGHGNVVVMSEAEFEGWRETVHLLRSPTNASRLLASIAEAEAGGATPRDLAG